MYLPASTGSWKAEIPLLNPEGLRRVWNMTAALCHWLKVSLVSLSLSSCNGYEIWFFLGQCRCHWLVLSICSRHHLRRCNCPEEFKVLPGECLKSLQKYISSSPGWSCKGCIWQKYIQHVMSVFFCHLEVKEYGGYINTWWWKWFSITAPKNNFSMFRVCIVFKTSEPFFQSLCLGITTCADRSPFY